MARLNRITPAEIPIHLIQRGNNKQACFANEQDFSAYLNWLKIYSQKYNVSIHAWVLMTNHVHILCTPHSDDSISKMMQSIGRQYVRYFNQQYQRTGTLWEGRYKSCLVQSETYLLKLYRYIELNPVRAKMVDSPSKYHWSSYQINALGKKSELCTFHPEHTGLGTDSVARQNAYKALFNEAEESKMIEAIRTNTNKSMALGNDQFKEEILKLTGRRVTPKQKGRPLLKNRPKNRN